MTQKYITTAIPYVNGVPHIGHAMDYCLADVCARYYKLLGDEVKMQAGADEHGGKIFQKAKELGVPVQEYVDANARKFQDFISKLDVSYSDYVRTSDAAHQKRVQEIWLKLKDHIYLEKYEGWYCTGCERFITQKEYDENNGVCPDHQKPYEKLKEENYYFKISDFKEKIRNAIINDEMRILPEFRKKEILKLLEDSPDVSISRPKSQLTWGVPVPDDDNQTMYVWLDALSNYITVLGYPETDISVWWPAAAQFVGKDILRFHAIIWPAMLLGLGLPLPKNIVSHGMVLADGQKMSKSIGNVVDPVELIDRYGVDAFRYFFLKHVDTFADADFTWEKFNNAYNNELANDFGNLVQRLSVMMSKNKVKMISVTTEMPTEYKKLMDEFRFSDAFAWVWEKVQKINKRIDDEKPWMLAKNGEVDKLSDCLQSLAADLVECNFLLSPFLPGATKKVDQIFTSGEITSPAQPLFPKQ
ncbi:methionine--tRNA ligase [Candidatus Saccharibacteria bacterium]|nr:methionine--tRNA ligase [Candidatus Saccharibacteria bacterium]